MLDKEQIKRVYQDKFFSQPSPLGDRDIQLQFIARYIPQDCDAAILDAGCGSGRYALKLAEMGYGQVHAVDLFDQPALAGPFRYVRASIDRLPFPPGRFDFVYANSVIYYLQDPEIGIKEFFRVLKPGGRALITAHTKYSLFTLERILRRAAGQKSARHLRGVRFHTASSYAAMFRQSGFQLELVDGYRLSMLLAPAYRRFACLIQRQLGLSLPDGMPAPSRGRLAARLRSELAYHSVLVAKKL